MKLFQQLLPETVLLTPNHRLAATFLKKYNAFQLSQKKSCWTTPDILPFQRWLERLWKTVAAENITSSIPLLLTPNQEQCVWEDILQQSPASDYLLQLADTANIVKSAWKTLKQWQVPLTHPDLDSTEDSRAFLQWAMQFEKIIQERHWIDASSLSDSIKEKIQENKIKLPKKIILMGFTELTPQQKTFLTLCEKNGTYVSYETASIYTQTTGRICLADEETEIRTMARWAKTVFATHFEKKELVSIACIVPTLEKSREMILSIFSDVFSEKNTYTLDHTLLPFNISAGKSLASYPVIQTALQLLNLNRKEIPIENISQLLLSPFLGDAEQESIARAHYDVELRKKNNRMISIKKLISSTTCPLLAKRLKIFSEALPHAKKTFSSNTWTKIFVELLTQLGWPGERSLNSAEYQVVQRWLKILTEYETFDILFSSANYHRALHHLTQLAAATVFQPESPEAPVQILGILEAAELPFDYSWVMGMDDNNWPPSAKPNPFIPHLLQKTLKMPHATAERELDYTQSLIKQLKNSAKHAIFSHAMINKESELRPSTLITDFDELTIHQLNLTDFIEPEKLIYQARVLESLSDEKAPPVLSDEKIQGGINIFKQQAACPFKAFSEIRLHAYPVEDVTTGLSTKDRGTIVHKTLEFIWKELNNSEKLNSLEEKELKKLIQDCASRAIKETTHQEIDDRRYYQLELAHLENIIEKWLKIEKTRPAFKVIACEKERKITIKTLSVTLRVDRIDELADGSKLIIDYKTGKNNIISPWKGDRLDEPQLPLYCIAESDATAISFAKIRAAKPEFQGISKKDITIKKINAIDHSWEEQIQEWKRILEQIGADFYEGHATVSPKYGNTTCRYCDLKALCRIYE